MLAADPFRQPEERGGAQIGALRGRQAGGHKETLDLVHSDPARIGVIGQALRQPLLGLSQLAFP